MGGGPAKSRAGHGRHGRRHVRHRREEGPAKRLLPDTEFKVAAARVPVQADGPEAGPTDVARAAVVHGAVASARTAAAQVAKFMKRGVEEMMGNYNIWCGFGAGATAPRPPPPLRFGAFWCVSRPHESVRVAPDHHRYGKYESIQGRQEGRGKGAVAETRCVTASDIGRSRGSDNPAACICYLFAQGRCHNVRPRVSLQVETCGTLAGTLPASTMPPPSSPSLPLLHDLACRHRGQSAPFCTSCPTKSSTPVPTRPRTVSGESATLPTARTWAASEI